MDSTILKLDLDMDVKTFNKFEIDFYLTRVDMLESLGYNLVNWSATKSTKYIHLKITITPKVDNPTKINILQWVCGDSAMRVMLNQRRIDAGVKKWNKLFLKKESI